MNNRRGNGRRVKHPTVMPPLSLRRQGDSFRWLPRSGEPSCIAEWISQWIVFVLGWWPAYVAIVVTLILLIQVSHPYGLGK